MKVYDDAVIYANAMHEYDAGVMHPLGCYEEMHDAIKEQARVSLLCAPELRNLMEMIQKSTSSDNNKGWFQVTLLASRDIILLGNTLWR